MTIEDDMARTPYSRPLCRELIERIQNADLRIPWRPSRYEDGDELDLRITTAWPETNGRAKFHIEKFVGGGFAGQVYRCRLESISLQDGSVDSGLREGSIYAVKILIPPSRFSARFRDVVYALAFQAPFSAQVLQSACRAGLLWPKLLRVAAEDVFGDRDAIADTYASFYDDEFRAYGEVREWVEGRTWHLEADSQMGKRSQWRTIDPQETGSPEFVAKHQFMVRLVKMLHDMGAPELARQYEWSTMKSQPNALKRTSGGSDPAAGLCAVDFRAGLALVPYLPMSPADFGLILAGLRRGSFAQFDRCNFRVLRAYAAKRHDVFDGHRDLIDALERYDTEYRRAMPDLSHQGFRLLIDRSLRHDVRRGLIAGYWSNCLVDRPMAATLEQGGLRFAMFYMLGAIPILGRFVRRMWGNPDFRRHVVGHVTSLRYLREAGRKNAAETALKWHRAGRVGETHARRIADHVSLFWLERLTVGLLPIPVLHRVLCEPWRVYYRIRDGIRYLRRFFRDANFREKWLREQIEDSYREGMLHEEDRDAILSRIKDPYIAQYLKSVGVHLATLPVTQIVSVTHASIDVALTLSKGEPWGIASARFLAILGIYQVTPISPGSICRGAYVVYLMIRDRNFKGYMIAAPLSFVKYIGYLAFPIQMTTTYPALSQLMASRWATGALHFIPVFGEKGALLEHMIFDLFLNVSRALGTWASKRIRLILTLWMLLGIGVFSLAFGVYNWSWTDKAGVNLIMAVTAIFLLPRLLFYPVLKRGKPAPRN